MDHYLNTARRLKNFFSPTLPIKHITQEYAEQFISQVDYLNIIINPVAQNWIPTPRLTLQVIIAIVRIKK